MKRNLLVAALAVGLATLHAQDPAAMASRPFRISGYLEVYYCYDLSNPSSHERPPFVYSFNRHNEVNLNMGYIKAGYSADMLRGNFALMAGTYAQYNLAGEPALLRNVFEANVGVKLSSKHNLWIDAGVMPSHIGFESAVGIDCWTLTRSMLADNTPYYESGVKLGYTSNNQKWYLAAMYLNGWQRIQRIPGNQTPAFGTQLTLKPNANLTLNWSTFVGNDQPDSLQAWRYFNNVYGQFQLSEKFGLIAGIDVGLQQIKTDTNAYNNWYTPILIVQYKPGIKTRIAARAEYYADPSEVIIATGTPNGFQTMGYSLNLDYLPLENLMFRVEARTWNSKDQIFMLNNKASNHNYFFTTSLALSF